MIKRGCHAISYSQIPANYDRARTTGLGRLKGTYLQLGSSIFAHDPRFARSAFITASWITIFIALHLHIPRPGVFWTGLGSDFYFPSFLAGHGTLIICNVIYAVAVPTDTGPRGYSHMSIRCRRRGHLIAARWMGQEKRQIVGDRLIHNQ